jgi:hypothetical protein
MDRRTRWLAIPALVVTICAALPSIASADHFRGGYITWKRPSGTGNTVEFESIQLWRSGAITPLEINPGVGDVTLIGPVSTIYTAVDIAGDAYTVISFKATYEYPGPGSYTAFLGIGTQDVTCCRIDDLVNSPDEPQRVATVVDITGGNTGSPVPAIPMVFQVQQNCPNTLPLLASDPDGFTCRLADMGGDDPGTATMFPIVAPSAPNDTLTVSGCALSWYPTGTAIGDKYAAQLIIEDSGADNTQIAVDLLIEVKPGSCPICGNNDQEAGEECDGTDDATCPGTCQSNCSCCGDLIIQPAAGEYCDGTNDAACPGNCQSNCTCCGDGITQPGAGEVCDGADNAACFPSPGFGCAGNCQCAVPGGGCSDTCSDDISVCNGTVSGVQTVDVGQTLSTTFLGTDPCDTLVVNDVSWGLLPPFATIVPGPTSFQNPPTMGVCSNDGSIVCDSCNDCGGAACTIGPNQFSVGFSATPACNHAAQTFGALVTYTPPGFTVPGGTRIWKLQ